MGNGFNLADVLGAANKLDIGIDGREQIEYIDIDLIDPDPNNFYELSNVDGLAANIELVGLQQPLRVRENPFDSKRFVVVSGHRRREALKLLVSEGKETFRYAACIREAEIKSLALRELRLIYANSDTRTMTSAEISKQAERVEALLYQLKEEGVEFPGRMRDHVAEACKVSKSKLSRLKVITEKLESPFAEQFQRGDLTEQAAYAIARLPMEIQWQLGTAVPKKVISGTNAENILREYGKGFPDRQCPAGGNCDNCGGKLKHCATAQYSWQYCSPDECCLKCSRRKECKGACKEAKKLNSEDAEIVKAEKEKAQREQEKRWEKNKKQTQKNAKRLLRAIDAADIADDTKLDEYNILPVKTVRQWAAGEFGERVFYSPGCEFYNVRDLLRVCKVLDCSADYLLGLTDELRQSGSPAVELQTGLPTTSGAYAAKFECEGYIMRKIAYFYTPTGKFYFDSSRGHSIEAECIGWIRLPDDF